jgi:predicted DNA-binding protein (UPF0251 family)
VSIDSGQDGESLVPELRDADATPFDQFATQEVQTKVRRALAEIPALFRSAVVLRDIEGLSYEEVAEVLDVSVGTVKSRILRGRRMLKEILDPLLHAPQAEAASEAISTVQDDLPRRHANTRLGPAPVAPMVGRAALPMGQVERTEAGDELPRCATPAARLSR